MRIAAYLLTRCKAKEHGLFKKQEARFDAKEHMPSGMVHNQNALLFAFCTNELK